eukprot:5467733-Amphidinium_carterae.1
MQLATAQIERLFVGEVGSAKKRIKEVRVPITEYVKLLSRSAKDLFQIDVVLQRCSNPCPTMGS